MDRSPITQIIAENIRTAAAALNLTPEDLAERTGYKPETMKKYFAGIRQPKAFMLYRIAKATGHTMEWFMQGTKVNAGTKPHGRLIDADKLSAIVFEALEVGRRTQAESKSNVIAGYIRAMNNMLEEIESAETVVEAER